METGTIMTREEFSAEMQAFSKDIRERFSGVDRGISKVNSRVFNVEMRFIHVDSKLNSNDLDHVRIGHEFNGIDRKIKEVKDEVAEVKRGTVWA